MCYSDSEYYTPAIADVRDERMILQYSPFFFPLLLSGGLTGIIACISIRNRSNPVALPFAVLMGAVTLWTTAYAVQLITADLATTLFFTDLEYIGIVTVPVAWLLVVLCYTGRPRYVTARNVGLLMIVPAIVVLLVATDPLHHLYYSLIYPGQVAGSVLWIFTRGPLFWINVGYNYILLMVSLILLASRFSGAPAVYRRQILILGIAVIVPVLANFVYLSPIDPVPGLDLTPFTFTAVGIVLAVGLFRYHLFLTLPVAYPQVFSAISDGIIVADISNRILDLNPAAQTIAQVPGELIGKVITSPFPQLSVFVANDGCIAESHQEIVIPNEGSSRWYDVTCRQLRISGQSPTGHLFILRDITDRHMALDALASAHRKLNLLSTVTRHDMMNKLTGLMVYLDLIRSTHDPAVRDRYLRQVDEIARMIRDEVAFTRDYQEMGVKSPAWQDLSACIASAKSQVDLGKIRVTEDCRGTELFADPLLVKVIINLLENAVRHGGSRLSMVRFSCRHEGDSLVIVCEDDGTGIGDTDKGRLFARGFGKNTGLGLFLSHEILAGTGLFIRENGIPGQGARFEITAPSGSFRVTGDTFLR